MGRTPPCQRKQAVMLGGEPTLSGCLSSCAGCFLSILSLNSHTDDEINIQRSQVICPGSRSQKVQEAGCPFWSIYKICSQPSRPCSLQAKSKKQTTLTYGVGIKTVAAFGEEVGVMEWGTRGLLVSPLTWRDSYE